MTKDEIADLRRCADELASWLKTGNLNAPPVPETVRRIAVLAVRAADALERRR